MPDIIVRRLNGPRRPQSRVGRRLINDASFTLSLPSSDLDAMRDLAVERGTTPSALMRYAVKLFIAEVRHNGASAGDGHGST